MKHLFHKGLYKEGLKQNSIIALIYFCIAEISAIIIPLSYIISASQEDLYYEYFQKTLIDGSQTNPIFYFSFLLFIPLMILNTFSFLNARNKSDFFHSIPHKRKTIFFSYILSIITWLVIILILSTLTSLCLYFFNGKYFSISFSSILVYLFNIFASCILTLGAGAIAISITGTIFTNIVTAGLILFLPRSILMIFFSAIQEKVPVLSDANLGFISNPNYNLFFGIFSGLIKGNSEDIYSVARYGLYSLAVGIVLIIIGCIFFTFRKSETAGSPALSRRIQAIIRIALSFIVSAVASLLLLQRDDPLEIITFYVISIVVYFTYEIITRKSFKTFPRILPGLGVLAALNIAFVIGVSFISYQTLHTNWETDRIDSINISYAQNPSYTPSYADYLIDETKIKNQEVLQQVSSLLTKNQAAIIKDEKHFAYNDYYQILENIIIRMKNGKNYHRKIYLSKEESVKLQKALANSELKDSLLSSMPENPSSIHVKSDFFTYSKEDVDKIYNSFKEEVSAFTEQDWSTYILNNGDLTTLSSSVSIINHQIYAQDKAETQYPSSDLFPINLTLSGYYGVRKYNSVFNINSLTPKTLSLSFQLGNQLNLDKLTEAWDLYQKDGLQTIDSIWNETVEAGKIVSSLDISIVNPQTNYYFNQYYTIENASLIPLEAANLFSTVKEKIESRSSEVNATKPTAYLRISVEDFVKNEEDTYVTNYNILTFAVNIDEKDLPNSSNS